MQHLAGLNPKQREAAVHKDGPLLIIAGAGAGKTKTITHRIVNLIKEGVAPEQILAVTFTNKAAKEMRERILAEITKNGLEDFPWRGVSQADGPRGSAPRARGDSDPAREESSRPFVSTFHSLGVYIIKENARLLGLTKYFTILDESDGTALVREALRELELDPKMYDPRKIKSIISREKGKFTHLADYRERARGTIERVVGQVWNLYEQKKKKENSLDFDDLLLKTVKLLQDNVEIRKIYQEKWRYVHVDEYQDTNEVQYMMTKLLTGAEKNICVVGDMDQCLVKGTKVKMGDGTSKKIEDVKKGELVLSNYGSGDFRPAQVSRKRGLEFKGNLIRIETESGKIITSTPDHTHFAGYRLGLTLQIHFNYLMYKKDLGWRIGTTSIHTKGQKRPMIGFIQRSNQEHADATWVIGTHPTQQAARVQEYIFSLKYQIPTLPFTPRKGQATGGYVHDKNALQKIFSSFDTERSALQLLSDLGLSQSHPHHRPQTSNTDRRNINVTLCADRRGKTSMHLISTYGSDDMDRKKLQSLGFSVRPTKKGAEKNWRFETLYSDYGKACLAAIKINSAFPEANIVFRARMGGEKATLREHNSLPHLPASSLMPGMIVFTPEGYDIVSKVSKIATQKIKVFDLDVEKTHNFIANGVLTHNCIYSWRGANLKNILSFEKDYPAAKIVLLEENYRSTQNILAAANTVIRKNKFRPEKNLFTQNAAGEKIGVHEALDEAEEAEFVAEKILELQDREVSLPRRGVSQADGPRGSAPRARGDSDPDRANLTSLSEISVLYRANFQSRALEEAMLRYNIPYQVLGVKFFERKEIKDTLAYLRAALNPESLSDIKRIINFPLRGIGKTTLIKMFSGTVETLPIKTKIKIDNFYKILETIKGKIGQAKASEVIKFTVQISGIEAELKNGTEEDQERLENIKELATLALKYDSLKNGLGVEKLLEDSALASEQDSLTINAPHPDPLLAKERENNKVKLMTVHASKGLEFKYVFVVGLEQGLFPHERENELPEDAEEERRLFYVALTRAKEKLFLSFANYRTIFGSRQINGPSEFLADIPGEFLENSTPIHELKRMTRIEF